MPARSDTTTYENALRAVLAALATDARGRGVGTRRFERLISEAVRDSRKTADVDLPYDVAVRLVSRWNSDKRYSRNGRARRLPMTGRDSFASLVRAARAGSASQVLQALERMALVARAPERSVVLLDRAFVPRAGSGDRLAIAGRHARDFVRLLVHNLSCGPEEVFLQRVASYDRIGASSLADLRTELRREGLRSLERANAALAARDRDRVPRAPGGRRTRVSYGVYMLAEPIGAAPRKRK